MLLPSFRSQTVILRLLQTALLLRCACSQSLSCGLPVDRDLIGPAMRCGVDCAAIALSQADQCRYDASDCGDSLGAGTSCQVACKPPFRGEATYASCPSGNTDSSTIFSWTPPECDLFASSCTLPEVLPPGYVQEEFTGEWLCDEGYAGEPVARCVPDENCESTLSLFGCEPKAKCAPPSELIGCVLDVTGCAGVVPGGACAVSCRFPYVGWSSVAVCHPDNTNGDTGLLVVQPECVLTCKDPPTEPQGYVKDPNSPNGWACAPGYGGTAQWQCLIDSVCASKKELSGCSLQANCILPDSGDEACRYDFTDCIGPNSFPGGSCKVFCRSPYQGNWSNASCPAGNTDPLRELDWDKKNCRISCDEVADVPIGYLSHPYVREYSGWKCVSSHSGVPVVSCSTDESCAPQLKFTGCKRLETCVGPNLAGGSLCILDAETCLKVASGGSCDVGCRAPYKGITVQAFCPPNNTQVGRRLIWNEPNCNLECPTPTQEEMPEGYLVHTDGGHGKPSWSCADKWEGLPVVKCGIASDSCDAAYQFTGCVAQTSCSKPTDSHCSVDWSKCDNVPAGESCDVGCKIGFAGNITQGVCPEGNTDPTTLLEWEYPGCGISCPEPAWPDGYQKLGWMCDANYSGASKYSCQPDFNNDCKITYKFAGCKALTPCAPPKAGQGKGSRLPDEPRDEHMDLCKFDYSDCQSVQPGETCSIRCGNGFTGRPSRAYCPADNNNPYGELLFAEPLCVMNSCELPDDNFKIGYVYERGCGWDCESGWRGRAEGECQLVGDVQGQCELKWHVQGCVSITGCAPLVANDTCRTNVTGCGSLQPGQSCNVTCQPPYIGGILENATWAYCPTTNTDPHQMPAYISELDEWVLDCEVICDDPEPPPVGYVRNERGRWICNMTAGYAGLVTETCVVNATSCEPEMVLEGCAPIVACDLPTFDSCQHDHDCPDDGKLEAGQSCEVRCISPYMTPLNEAHGSVVCPFGNTDSANGIWTPPRCILGCPRTTSQTGYTKATGTWMCDEGYLAPGAIWENCEVDPISCVVAPVLTGCHPYVPCAAPEFTTIRDSCTTNADDGDDSCQAVDPEGECVFTCRPPYQGYPIGAKCPARNIDSTTVLYAENVDLANVLPGMLVPRWTPPTCHCPAPDPVPDGYVNLAASYYRCAPGYRGQAYYRCDIAEDCSYKIVLSGCYPIVNCSKPLLYGTDICRYNIEDCETGFDPGTTCNVTCGPGLDDNLTTAYCPATNIDPNYVPEFELGCGEYECEAIDTWVNKNDPPPGYVQGDWECAEGYRGQVRAECYELEGACGGSLQLTGCTPLAPCRLPTLAHISDSCKMNMTYCDDLMPGEFCEVLCMAPFYGDPGSAFCMPDNIDPNQELTWSEPHCHLNCTDPDPIPVGYQKTEECGWLCAPGYEGFPNLDCGVDEDCNPRLIITGCTRAENCTAPKNFSYDPCRFEFADCFAQGAIRPGFSCTGTCKTPYTGPDFDAVCLSSNIIPDGDLVYSHENCGFACEDPEPLPAGYVRAQSGEWVCDAGYLGIPIENCSLGLNCGAPELHLSGCFEIVPCAVPVLEDACKFEAVGCEAVPPGGECEIKCFGPYEGNSSIASCAFPNTNPDQPLEYVALECELICPPLPALPEAYDLDVDGSVICSKGAIGLGSAKCEVRQNCTSFWNFTGCNMLRSCVLPQLDTCRIDIGNCSSLGAGEDCLIGCADPYLGHPVNGSCPDGNIDPLQEVILDGEIDCKCPPAPDTKGYVMKADQGLGPDLEIDGGYWQCSADYAGSAVSTCTVQETCKPKVELTGCHPIFACAPPSQSHLGDRRYCQRVPSGESCLAPCLPSECVGGGPLVYQCPAENIDPNRMPDLVSGRCLVRCEICDSKMFVDIDERPGYLSGKVRFGEAHASGLMPVHGIQGYNIFFADDCGIPVSFVGYLPGREMPYECCAPTAYQYTLEGVPIPAGATSLRVAVNMSFGELLHAARVDFTDLTGPTTTTTPFRVITSAGRRSVRTELRWWLLLAALR